jgi:archaetidylinositol phosphate synthase
LLNKVRDAVTPFLNKAGGALAKTGISATGWSFFSLIVAALSGAAYAGLMGADGWVLGGLLLLGSGFFDIVDGAVARATRSVSKRGAFIDSNFDRIAEVLVYGGILAGGIGQPIIVFAALSTSILVSYSRARGESLNVKLSGIGIGERAERIFILALTSITGYPYYGVILVLAVAAITFLHRLIYTIKALGVKDISRPSVNQPS